MKTLFFYIPSHYYQSYLQDIELPNDAELIVITAVKIFLPSHLKEKCRVIDAASVLNNEDLNVVVRKGIDTLHQWALKKHEGASVSLIERWVSQNASMWWISGYLYFYNEFLHVVKIIELFKRVIQQNNVAGIISVSPAVSDNLASEFVRKDDGFYYEIGKQLAEKNSLDFIKLVPHRGHWYRAWKNKAVDRLKVFLLKRLFEPLSMLIRRSSAKIPMEIDGLVVSPSPNFGRIYNLHTGEEQFGDSKLGYFLQFLNGNTTWKLAGVDANSIPDLNRSRLKKRVVLDTALPWMPVEKFLSVKDYWEVREEFQKLKLSSGELQVFLDELKYGGLSLRKILLPRFRLINEAFLFSGMIKMRAFANLIARLKPKFLVLTYETGLHGRSACSAAHAKNIHVLGIQHGKIHMAHPQYVIPGASNLQQLSILFPPTVDKLAVFGPATARVLTEMNGYPASVPVITGQIASDSLGSADKIYNKDRFCSENRIKNTSPILLILSQNLETREEYDYFYSTILSNAGQLPHTILVKLHPREKKEKIQEIINSFIPNSVQVYLFQKEDLYELIWYSDIVVTGNSTTGMDALSLGKPLITVEGFKYAMGYEEAGASIGVQNSRDFVLAVRELMENAEARKIQQKKGLEYMSQFRLQPDGMASFRVYQVLKEWLK